MHNDAKQNISYAIRILVNVLTQQTKSIKEVIYPAHTKFGGLLPSDVTILDLIVINSKQSKKKKTLLIIWNSSRTIFLE